jgi:hypothetical protein
LNGLAVRIDLTRSLFLFDFCELPRREENVDRSSFFHPIFLSGNADAIDSLPSRRRAMVFQLISKEQHVMSNLPLIKDILLPNSMMGIVCMTGELTTELTIVVDCVSRDEPEPTLRKRAKWKAHTVRQITSFSHSKKKQEIEAYVKRRFRISDGFALE